MLLKFSIKVFLSVLFFFFLFQHNEWCECNYVIHHDNKNEIISVTFTDFRQVLVLTRLQELIQK